MDQYVSDMKNTVKASKTTKTGANKKSPTVMELIQQDSELKDFFKLVHENDFRDKAVALLRERISQMKH